MYVPTSREAKVLSDKVNQCIREMLQKLKDNEKSVHENETPSSWRKEMIDLLENVENSSDGWDSDQDDDTIVSPTE